MAQEGSSAGVRRRAVFVVVTESIATSLTIRYFIGAACGGAAAAGAALVCALTCKACRG